MRHLFALLLMSVALPAFGAPDGARLYSEHCAACHGLDGHGGVGIPIGHPDFLATVSDDYLARTVREGRPGRVMPGYRGLSDAQVSAIVRYLRQWQPAQRQPPKEEWTAVSGNAEAGRALFARNCAECHGERGEGGHGTGVTFSRPRDFAVIPPALNNPGFLRSASDRFIRQALVHGRSGDPAGPATRKQYTDKQKDDLVAFVRSFEKSPLVREQKGAAEPVLLAESPYSVEETLENLKRAAGGKNYRIIRVQTVEDGLFPEEQQNKGQMLVYFCNFEFINRALAIDPRVGMFMPCRVTIYEEKGKVKLSAMNPVFMSRMFNNAELDRSCNELRDQYLSIMEEATL